MENTLRYLLVLVFMAGLTTMITACGGSEKFEPITDPEFKAYLASAKAELPASEHEEFDKAVEFIVNGGYAARIRDQKTKEDRAIKIMTDLTGEEIIEKAEELRAKFK